MTAVSEQATPGDHVPVPPVVASYAAYLRARTHAAPEATVTGEHARLALTIGDKTLTLAFEATRREWSLTSAEIRHGEQATAFSRGELAAAVTEFLRPSARPSLSRLWNAPPS